MSYATTDLSDQHPEAQVCDSVFRDFGGRRSFHGLIATAKVFEDNALVRTMLEEKGEGRVLVVDGGGSMRCALLGGNLGQLAVKNGWSGIVAYGCIRDSKEIAGQAIGVKALALSSVPSQTATPAESVSSASMRGREATVSSWR